MCKLLFCSCEIGIDVVDGSIGGMARPLLKTW